MLASSQKQNLGPERFRAWFNATQLVFWSPLWLLQGSAQRKRSRCCGRATQANTFSFRSLSLQGYNQNLLAYHQARVSADAFSFPICTASLGRPVGSYLGSQCLVRTSGVLVPGKRGGVGCQICHPTSQWIVLGKSNPSLPSAFPERCCQSSILLWPCPVSSEEIVYSETWCGDSLGGHCRRVETAPRPGALPHLQVLLDYCSWEEMGSPLLPPATLETGFPSGSGIPQPPAQPTRAGHCPVCLSRSQPPARPTFLLCLQVALHRLPGRYAACQLWGPPLHLSGPQWPADSL